MRQPKEAVGLREYKAKRNFMQTAEPAGKTLTRHRQRGALFVVQKHAATRLHYDFRLEMEGVLKSWAVPKGFPTRNGDRRLAVEVEDHPLDYADFEGTIPAGNYGAGTVMVWDTGSYETPGEDALRALRRGKLPLSLKGKKLKGEWTLVRMKPRPNEDKPQWLLLKSGQDIPEFTRRAENSSVLTHRTLEQIGAENDRVWTSNRAEAKPAEHRRNRPRKEEGRGGARRKEGKSARSRTSRASTLIDLKSLPAAEPGFIEPMKARLSATLPTGADWLYEIKFDGVRALAIKDRGTVSLISRAGKDLGSKYFPVVETLADLPAERAVLDGEVVAVDAQGRPSFQLLQSWQSDGAKRAPLIYYVFDLIHLEGKNLAKIPLVNRKEEAERLVAGLEPKVRFSRAFPHSSELVAQMKTQGLEGLVAKRADSAYEPGVRSGAWVKYKWSNEQEFVIGGYTEPQGARSHFGALLVGYYADGKLLFAGKVGTGFDEKGLDMLYRKFQELKQKECPFANLPEKLPHLRGRGLTAGQMRSCTWVKPLLVCQVRFAEWTRDHHLRQPAFLGLREDKDPSEVIREIPA